ncbi:MAG: hypothetical protein K0S25_2249 [Bacillus sp. (in: firmicutes)]|nr:hypothetical protein [Bacillus sp. (in: firmicutes)]
MNKATALRTAQNIYIIILHLKLSFTILVVIGLN